MAVDSKVEVLFMRNFALFSKKLQEGGYIEQISDEFKKKRSDLERIKFVQDLPNIESFFQFYEEGEKNFDSAQALKVAGNKAFQEKDDLRALDLYNDSIANVPSTGEDCNSLLSLSIANRSAVLFHMKQFKECIQDIDQALSLEYPKELCFKLYDRKAKCLFEMRQLSMAKNCLKKVQDYLEYAKLDEKKKNLWDIDIKNRILKCNSETNGIQEETELVMEKMSITEKLPEINLKNEKYQSLSSACDVQATSDAGRFIVATQDIEPGDVILVEKPYAAVVLPNMYHSHCHHCYDRYLSAVPCLSCTKARFCSVSCRDEALSYHKYECGVLETVCNSGIDKFGLLAIRTVTRSGPELLHDFMKTLNSHDKNGLNPDGLYKESSYNAIYHLVTHDQDRKPHDLFRRACMAVFLHRCLLKSSFFAGYEKDSYFQSFVGGLILSHLQLLPCNAHEISEFQYKRDAIATSLTLEIGAGIYSTLSLFNHSCDPSVTRNFYQDVCVVRATKFIKAGEEIADNYGALFPVQSIQERKQKLLPQYFFECHCHACCDDWPLYSNIPHAIPMWRCTKCHAPLDLGAHTQDETSCAQCKEIINMPTLRQTLKDSQAHYRRIFEKLAAGDVEDALLLCTGILSWLSKRISPPFRDINDCQELIKQCYNLKGNNYILPN